MGLYLNMALIVVSIALMIVIVLQSRGAGLGGLTGGDYSGTGFHVRRGIERLLFNVTIALSVIFFVLAVLNVLLVG
ncbi:MAG: preprotein translocase subunit SecG [Chloroflexi bacterium RBG_13_68_17]|jgi:preprotein translocase subunit SecG|nr:MAG: preprotein translocase subunit SecG [Chloroflexi bacterium RBG_13_68_17]